MKILSQGRPFALSVFAYAGHRPLSLIDPDGNEPEKAQAGTAAGIGKEIDQHLNHPTGTAAIRSLDSIQETHPSLSGNPYTPKNTRFLNEAKNRYVYTWRGGWIDMDHFMFYAATAQHELMKGRNEDDAIKAAIETGFDQEWLDSVDGNFQSAYSYEDLPSDRFGAEFGATFFDPTSKKTLGEQVEQFLNNLPRNAVDVIGRS